MSMMTTTKSKKKNRWQAVMVAALVLAGTVAIPQAADAASKTTTCGKDSYSCTTSVSAKGTITFRVADTSNARKSKSFTVKNSRGTTLCSGKITTNSGSKTCSLFGYKGTVKITVAKDWFSGVRISTSY